MGLQPVHGAVVLAGGRSRRMGRAKADLPWRGSTLLHSTVDVLVAAVAGPVVVVGAPGQVLPALPAGTDVATDPVEGLGPLQGLATGLVRADELGCSGVFVCSTDLPFLHPAYVRRVLAALRDGVDAVLPVVRGYRQPTAAAYLTGLAPLCAALVAQGRLRPAFLLDQVRTLELDDAALLADDALRAADPGLRSVVGVNTPQEYEDATAQA